MLVAAAKNVMLDAFPGTHVSLHTAYSTSGANEASGGSYARQAVTFGAAASGSKAHSNAPAFPVPAGTYAFMGYWSASTAGTFYGMTPLGGDEADFAVDLSADTVKRVAHGYSNGQEIVFVGGTPPGGLTEGTIYFVVGAATDTFQVAATAGGSAINLTSEHAGACKVSKIVRETYASAGTHTISSGSIALTE